MSDKSTSKLSDLRLRSLFHSITSSILIFFLFFAQITFIKWIFLLAVSIIYLISFWEVGRFFKAKHVSLSLPLGYISGLLFLLSFFLFTQGYFSSKVPLIVLGAIFAIQFVSSGFVKQSALLYTASSWMAFSYLAVPFGFFIGIVYFFSPENAPSSFAGNWWLAYLIFVTKATDLGGYFIGKRFGKRKLAKKISPNKTIEGAVAGIIASVLMSLLIYFLSTFRGNALGNVTLVVSILLGFFVGVFAILGDLAESLLKRDAGIKDSNSLPGIGGVLDMMDSLLFTSPVIYLFLLSL